MPRDAHSVAKAVDMLDLLIEFFDDGDRWIKGKLDDGAGNRCLVGALRMDWTDFVQRPVQGFRRTARGHLTSPQAGGQRD